MSVYHVACVQSIIPPHAVDRGDLNQINTKAITLAFIYLSLLTTTKLPLSISCPPETAWSNGQLLHIVAYDLFFTDRDCVTNSFDVVFEGWLYVSLIRKTS